MQRLRHGEGRHIAGHLEEDQNMRPQDPKKILSIKSQFAQRSCQVEKKTHAICFRHKQ